MTDRDVDRSYSHSEFAAKLRRLADSVESGNNFEIQVAGERIYVPDRAVFSIEHEREGADEELEFQIKWSAE
jgi:amphi-Trp domain-containing protein